MAHTTDDKVVNNNDNEIIIKIGVLGDLDVGKSSFIRRYVCNTFQASSYGYYNNSPGSVLFLKKLILMKHFNLFIHLWCSTTYSVYDSQLELICNKSHIIIFMFSLLNKQSLNNIKLWYYRALSVNKGFIPILIGTKYDEMCLNIAPSNPQSSYYLNEYYKITKQARKCARKMNSPLIYISSADNININHVIKHCISRVFNIKTKYREYNVWNTLKPLRQHNINKFLKCWSNKKNMKNLIYGYLKINNINININKKCIQILINYLRYTLIPKKYSKSTKNNRKLQRKQRKQRKKRIGS